MKKILVAQLAAGLLAAIAFVPAVSAQTSDPLVNALVSKGILTAEEAQKIKAEVDDLLVKQGRIEAALFEVQREVAITLDEVYELEAKLAAREQELLKLSPAP